MNKDKISFEEAIVFTQSLLTDDNLQPGEIARGIRDLVATENGARGFFVTYLTQENLPNNHPPYVIRALKSSPEIVSELLVKNLAMSTAMTITHRRQNNEKMAQSSINVTHRTTKLIQLLELNQITAKLTQMRESAATDKGNYSTFLQRWGYDQEQKQVIGEKMTQLL